MNTLTNLPNNWLRLLPGLGLVFLSAGAAQAQISTAALPITWTGAQSNLYTAPANWNFGRSPNPTDYVRIPVTARQPILDVSNGIGVAGPLLTIDAGASLTLQAQGELDLYGDLQNNGGSATSFGGGGLLSIRSIIPVGSTTPTLTAHTITSASVISINDVETQANAPTNLNAPVRLTRSLTLGSNLNTTAANTLTLLSSATTTAFIVNVTGGGVVNGPATVQRYIDNSVNTGLGYRHYSTPVSGNAVSDFSTATFTPVLTTSYNESTYAPGTRPFPTVELYDQVRVTTDNGYGNFDRGFFIPSLASTPLLVGRGYAVNLGGSELVDFVGTPSNGPVAVSITRNAANTTAAGDAGWQFLGNPYPSAIDWSRPAAVAQRTSAGLDDGMYVYTSTSQYGGYYRAYSGGSGNPVIPLGQGFFVRKTAAGTSTFTFSNDFRLTSSDGTTFQRTAASVRPQLEMALSSGDKVVQDMLNVYFDNGSTAGVDAKYDALKMSNNNGMFLGTFTTDGQELAIDGRPLPTDRLTIPLHVAVSASGVYTLKPTKLENMGDLHVYLHDKRLGSFTDLSQQPEYTFNLNSVNPAARFELVFTKQPITEVAPAALTQQVMLYPSPAKGVVFLELPTSLGGEAMTTTLLDGMGRVVRTTNLDAEGEATHQVDLQGLHSGIYVLQLHTSAGIVAKRLVVE